MKYVAQATGGFLAVDEASAFHEQLMALPKDRRPVFVSPKNKALKEYLLAQSKAAGVKRK